MITIEIWGKPVPLKRARHNKGRFYDPQQKEKQQLQWVIKSQFNQQPWPTAINMRISFFFSPPKHLSAIKRRQMLSNVQKCVKRPDLSNLIKFIEDAANGILWEDDSQIVSLEAQKLYGEKEKTLIQLTPAATR